MPSLTKKTWMIRRRKHRAAGTRRKTAIRRDGTTPKFAVHQS